MELLVSQKTTVTRVRMYHKHGTKTDWSTISTRAGQRRTSSRQMVMSVVTLVNTVGSIK